MKKLKLLLFFLLILLMAGCTQLDKLQKKTVAISSIEEVPDIVDIRKNFEVTLNLNNSDHLFVAAIRINGKDYAWYNSITANDDETQITVQVESGNTTGTTTYTVDQIIVGINKKAVPIEIKDNNQFSAYVMDEVTITDIDFDKDYYSLNEEMTVDLGISKKPDYTIESIKLGEHVYHADEFLVNDPDKISIKMDAGHFTGVQYIQVTEMTYSYQGKEITDSLSIQGDYFVKDDIMTINAIYTVTDLQNMDLHSINILMNDLDLSSVNWKPFINFNGYFDGNHHKINNITIDYDKNDVIAVGFFASNDGLIKNIGLENMTVTSTTEARTGGLVGWNQGAVIDSYASGEINGNGTTGGLIGYSIQGFITGCHFIGTVNGNGNITGGFIGEAKNNISKSYSESKVNGLGNRGHTGGFIGSMSNIGDTSFFITDSYATGDVFGTGDYTGGFIGYNYDCVISKAYSTGNVTGTSLHSGGFAGENSGIINNVYVTGNINSNSMTAFLAEDGKRNIVINSYCYENQEIKNNAGNIQVPDEYTIKATAENLRDSNWYRDILGFNNLIWDLSSVNKGESPSLR